ncbi:transposase [Nocardia brasiliensis]|uniref:transposase n=1 Tax=Nocardia brasiliensis TaxID=37326 RepID=UPI003672D9E8
MLSHAAAHRLNWCGSLIGLPPTGCRAGSGSKGRGIGPSSAARLLADTEDIHRFGNRDRFASWNGTAPLDASSGQQQRHRLSRAGNRKINRVLQIMAVVRLRHHTPGRVYYDGPQDRREELDGSTTSSQTMTVECRLRAAARRPAAA